MQTVWSFFSVVAIFACVILHELAHALVASRYGIRTKDITLWPIGGLASMEKIPEKPREEIAISAAGPVVNLLIALLMMPFLDVYTPFWKASYAVNSVQPSNFLYYLHTINIMLAVFNLIPAFPMDGGRILRGILGLFSSYDRATAMAAITGRIIAACFILAGLVTFNLVLAIVGVFLIIAGSAEEYLVYLKAAAGGLRLKELVNPDFGRLDSCLSIREAAGRLLQCHNKYFVLTAGDKPIGVVDRNVILNAVAEGRHDELTSRLIHPATLCLNEDSPAIDAIDKLMQKGPAIYPVTDGHQLTGIVNLESVAENLLIRNINSAKVFPGAGAIARLLH